MAKTYQQRNAESIAKTGKSLYERRANRGHHPQEKPSAKNKLVGKPRTKTHQKPAPKAAPKEKLHKVPKTGKKITLPKGGFILATNSTNVIAREINKIVASGNGSQRVYFELFNRKTGEWMPVYHGNRNKAHGITALFFLEKVQKELNKHSGMTIADAIKTVLSDDVGKDDSPTSPALDADKITQVRMYVMPQNEKAA